MFLWRAAIPRYPQVFSAILLSQKEGKEENVLALSLSLFICALKGFDE
jgi:hypothetical protein